MLDPDQRLSIHGMSDSQLRLAERLETEAERRKREILGQLGVRVNHNAPWPEITRDARRKGIVVNHHMDDDHPEGGGWFFNVNGVCKVILGHPYIEKGRIKFRERHTM